MARQIVVDIVGDASKFKKATNDATDSATHLGVSLKTLSLGGLAIGAGSAAASAGIGLIASAADMAASAVIDFAVGSINAASDLNETVSKSNVIFGDGAAAVEKWGQTMAVAGGLSERAALDAASGFAGLFKTVGLSIDKSTQMSEKLTQMGSDLASFFNTDVETALDALKSGLNGESEPLRRFNVFLSETAVSAELAHEGVKKVGGQFTEAQKATARYNIILQQTGDAQGDFVRTSDGLANSQRTLGAEIENLQAEIGQELLPVVKDLTAWAKNDLVPAIVQVVDVMKQAGEGAKVVSFALDSMHDPIGATTRLEASLKDEADKAFGEAAVKKVEDYVAAHKNLVPAAAGAAGAVSGVASASGALSGKLGPLKSRVEETGNAFKTTRDKVLSLSDAFLEAAFTPEQLKLELQSTNLELKIQKGHLDDLEAKYAKHPSNVLKKDIVDLKLEISNSTEKTISLKAKIDALDGTTTKEVQAEVKAVGTRAKNAQPEVNDLTGSVRDLESAAKKASDAMFAINSNVPGGPSNKNRATGGPVMAGGVYTVGEDGPETLVMGNGAGYVLPHGPETSWRGGGGGGGGGQVININIASFTGSDRDIDHFADRLALRMRLAGA